MKIRIVNRKESKQSKIVYRSFFSFIFYQIRRLFYPYKQYDINAESIINMSSPQTSHQ